jgi:hypothetical protein
VKRLVLALLIAQAASAAVAQAGPTTQTMTCARVQGLVAAQGAVVLHTGPTTYDRFVRDSSFCPHPLTAQTAFVRTADVAHCPIGGLCQETTVETNP